MGRTGSAIWPRPCWLMGFAEFTRLAVVGKGRKKQLEARESIDRDRDGGRLGRALGDN